MGPIVSPSKRFPTRAKRSCTTGIVVRVWLPLRHQRDASSLRLYAISTPDSRDSRQGQIRTRPHGKRFCMAGNMRQDYVHNQMPKMSYNSSLGAPELLLLFVEDPQTAGVPTSILYTHFSSSVIFQISSVSAHANTTSVLLLGPFQQCCPFS